MRNDDEIVVTQTPDMVRRLARRFDPGSRGTAEPDICGRLPSGEHCCMDFGHQGPHRSLHIEKRLTEYQDE